MIHTCTTANATTPIADAANHAGRGSRKRLAQNGWRASRSFGEALRIAFTYASISNSRSWQELQANKCSSNTPRLASESVPMEYCSNSVSSIWEPIPNCIKAPFILATVLAHLDSTLEPTYLSTNFRRDSVFFPSSPNLALARDLRRRNCVSDRLISSQISCCVCSIR